MRSQVFQGETTHCRHQPCRHAFRYRMFWLALDLDELPELDRCVRGFGHNRRALVSIRDRDYGGPSAGTIRAKIESMLLEAGVLMPIERITVMTVPRIAGYVFNPVSFYLCRASEGRIAALLAEVRNTFGEMHHYVAQPEPSDHAAPGPLSFRIRKQFFVSPFFDVDGDYEVRMTAADDRFDLAISLSRAGTLAFSASMRGEGVPLTSRTLLATLCRLPLYATTVMLRIHWQACLLYLRRRLPMHDKPDPSHPSTIPAPHGGFWYRLRAACVGRARRQRSRSPG